MAQKSAQEFYDITPKLNSELGVFPGDKAFSRSISLDFPKDHLQLSSVETTLHLGAHADGPSHYQAGAVGIDQVDPLVYFGLAQVIRPNLDEKPKNFRLPLKAIQSTKIIAKRVLIDTCSFQNPYRWNSDFLGFEPELIDFLADSGVQLIGTDTPSFDPEDCKQLLSHQRMSARGLHLLEGLLLRDVPVGVYWLSALPLPIEGGDASPVRAILFEPHWLKQELTIINEQ